MKALVALAASAVALIAAPGAGATTYNNDTPIIIPDAGLANPYPSSITVSGTAGPITDVNVGFDGFSNDSPEGVAMVLVAPTGQALLLLDCVGGGFSTLPVFITLDDPPASQLPDNTPLSTGTFRPTSHCPSLSSFPAPGPLTTYANPGPGGGDTATFASTFNGLSAIGTWNLYVRDLPTSADGGSIPGGWSLDVKPDVTPPPPATGITCGTGTVLSGSQCVVKKKKKRKKKKRKKK